MFLIKRRARGLSLYFLGRSRNIVLMSPRGCSLIRASLPVIKVERILFSRGVARQVSFSASGTRPPGDAVPTAETIKCNRLIYEYQYYSPSGASYNGRRARGRALVHHFTRPQMNYLVCIILINVAGESSSRLFLTALPLAAATFSVSLVFSRVFPVRASNVSFFSPLLVKPEIPLASAKFLIVEGKHCCSLSFAFFRRLKEKRW